MARGSAVRAWLNRSRVELRQRVRAQVISLRSGLPERQRREREPLADCRWGEGLHSGAMLMVDFDHDCGHSQPSVMLCLAHLQVGLLVVPTKMPALCRCPVCDEISSIRLSSMIEE